MPVDDQRAEDIQRKGLPASEEHGLDQLSHAPEVTLLGECLLICVCRPSVHSQSRVGPHECRNALSLIRVIRILSQPCFILPCGTNGFCRIHCAREASRGSRSLPTWQNPAVLSCCAPILAQGSPGPGQLYRVSLHLPLIGRALRLVSDLSPARSHNGVHPIRPRLSRREKKLRSVLR